MNFFVVLKDLILFEFGWDIYWVVYHFLKLNNIKNNFY